MHGPSISCMSDDAILDRRCHSQTDGPSSHGISVDLKNSVLAGGSAANGLEYHRSDL